MNKKAVQKIQEKAISIKDKGPVKSNRRKILKILGLGATGMAVMPLNLKASGENTPNTKNVKWVMVIDLQKCTGCGACTLACKNENNVPDGMFWASHISQTEGTFPNVRHDYIPTLCNHCAKAPCVKVCPTSAMHKSDGDITMHDPNKCIGCRYCMIACPYNVISFNDRESHTRWRTGTATIEDCTSVPEEVTKQVNGNVLPYSNPEREDGKYIGIRPKGIVEKCTLCNHRTSIGKLPYCVEKCPPKARVFGDLNDPDSEVSKLLGKYTPFRLKEHLGTEPKIYYIRSYNPGEYSI
jgi:molybdopterin-containing oxidoreductase family iron-sulfur binding subunit